MMKRVHAISMAVTVAGGLLASCSEAQFHGNPPSTAQKRSEETPKTTEISCKLKPGKIQVGESARVTISTKGDVGDELYQTWKGKGGSQEATLVFKKDSWKRKGGEKNAFKPNKPGKYDVKIRRFANEKPVASCQLQVKPKPEPPCNRDEISVGPRLAFLIDNSTSNEVTDCSEPKRIDDVDGHPAYQCQEQTNREKAVLAVHDLLARVSKEEPDNAKAESQLSVASFPTKEEYLFGSREETDGWLPVTSDSRSQTAEALEFTRQPFGQTPYGSALETAQTVFSGAPDDGREKVAVLVTDGEPTDRDPKKVAGLAEELKESGVKMITVFVTGEKTRQERQTTHRDMMSHINDVTENNGDGPWYAPNRYDDFSDYMSHLMGTDGMQPLAERIASTRPPECEGAECERNFVEVQKSEDLKEVFLSLVKTKAIRCE